MQLAQKCDSNFTRSKSFQDFLEKEYGMKLSSYPKVTPVRFGSSAAEFVALFEVLPKMIAYCKQFPEDSKLQELLESFRNYHIAFFLFFCFSLFLISVFEFDFS
ncbi:hypothetical protein M0811_06207 [Anaeramoeba ignava]|uniref:Uncharacterized protein n=1 Tax=Anaeramoeba ignava TaxID=1746090 RepID=A0A9Q0LPJ3_ANAIG|nr:hypothetical protein M0811_06207 [Anaeramoeba ignava]